MNIRKEIVVAIGAVSFLSGGGITYLLLKKNLEMTYQRIAEKEIAEARRYYSIMKKTDEDASPVTAAESRYAEKVDELQYGSATHPVLAPDVSVEVKVNTEPLEEALENAAATTRNVFDNDDTPDFILEDEMRYRSENAPYVVNHEEFMQNEPAYDQVTVTYFAGDDVLCDERDKPIDDTGMVVGDSNLQRFGHGSADNNIVYIRNDRLEQDFEVVRSGGEYKREILGFMEHSHRPGSGKVRKFRDDDG